MKNSLENTCEQYFVELFKTDSRLKNRKMAHSDTDQKASADGIIIEAVQGEPEINGIAGFNVDVTCTYRANGAVKPGQGDTVALAMNETIMDANNRKTTAQSKFAPLIIMVERMTSERPDSANLRKRVLKVPVIAKLA